MLVIVVRDLDQISSGLRRNWFSSDTPVIWIGRSAKSEVVLGGDKVSKQHARIFFSGQDVKIADNKSTNGTYLNGNQIKAGLEANLSSGDCIGIGNYVLQVELSNSDELPTSRMGQQETVDLARVTQRLALAQISVPTYSSIRKLINAILATDSELDAFCLDHFTKVKQRFSAGMDRVAKINLLLESANRYMVLIRLKEDFPDKTERNQHLLIYEALDI